MTARKGSLSVQTADIFPIIKKWLYSEHDIFLRELIANATDAITKRATLSRTKNLVVPAPKITVEVDKAKGTITLSDNGLGMTEQEVEKYIAQLAFSGAQEFVEKLKKENNGQDAGKIIGKFGLGFYSAFMVAKQVEVETLSMNEGAVPTKWVCQGETDYEFFPSNKSEVGTTITLTVGDDGKEFLESYKTRETLKRYCDFLPYPIELVDVENRTRILEENLKATKPEEIKPLENDIINDTAPLWTKDPKEISEEDYRKFYERLYPFEAPPLFWVHLKIDHPFDLTGILYFPKINMQKPIQEQNIKLYCKQVFVSDTVKDIIPEFLSLLKGVIDSVDIPLNVSRSSLQGDPNVKKIANYIIRKVAESLKKLFETDRSRFETIWEDIKLFVKYGIISDEKFDELMRPYLMFANSENKLVTLEEYTKSIPEKFQEKLKDKVITFEKNQSDESLRRGLLAEGVQTIETEAFLDPHLTQHIEFKKAGDKEYKFVAIDNEFENILGSSESESDASSSDVKKFFSEALDLKEEGVETKTLSESSLAYFKVDQMMKRMQQMTRTMGGGMDSSAFPTKKTLVVNPKHGLVKKALSLWNNDLHKPLAKKMAVYVQDLAQLSSEGMDGKKREEFVQRSQDLMENLTRFIQ
ncbi:MAG: molecular chaperone HtpG [Bacteriovoracaceae bacterium]|nr:molecular chaperone HtpG [Bacteriovoracaceae bacterium]